jgi:hypothetical protein
VPTLNRRRFNIGLFLGFAHAASAQAAFTKVITGDKGFAKQSVNSANLYDATGLIVRVEQGRNNTGVNITSSPPGAIFTGGRVLGVGANQSLPWDNLYARGNGGCIRAEKSPGITIRGVYGEYTWDGIKPVSGTQNFTIEDCQLKHCRDDAVEDDAQNSGVVRRCFFDRVHTFLSVNPGGGAAITRQVNITWEECVMSLGCGLPDGKACEDRAKRLKYAWACPTGSGQPWKVTNNNKLVRMRYANNAAMIEGCINQSKSNLRWFNPAAITLLPGSTGNRFYYLGTGKGLTMINVTNPDGSKARVPAEFGIVPGPVWARVSNSRPEWEAEIARWQAAV